MGSLPSCVHLRCMLKLVNSDKYSCSCYVDTPWTPTSAPDMKQSIAAPSSHFERLDDSCVLQIMHHLDPKPDVFQLARTCQRFKRLAHDTRNWLVVLPTSTATSALVAGSGHGPVRFASFKRAVEASRPGDTLLLLCGQHQLQGVVVIDKCLSIVAQGRMEDTLLCSSTKAEPALDIRATCKITNISISAHCAPCVMHRSGQLHLERCHLTCHAHGLDHLCAPIVTSASTSTSTNSSSSSSSSGRGTVSHHPRAEISAQLMDGQLQHKLRSQGTASTSVLSDTAHFASKGSAQPQDGHGRLTVTECLLEGGTRGVLCNGTGQLQGVRVIYQAHRALFYLEVDCRVPGTLPALTPSPPRAARMGTSSHVITQQGARKTSSVVGKGVGGVGEEHGQCADRGNGMLTGVAALAQLGGLLMQTSDARGQFEMHFTAVRVSQPNKHQKPDADSDMAEERSSKRVRH